MPGKVSARLFSAAMNFESSACCHTAGVQLVTPSTQKASVVVPWFEPAKPITSSTMGRVSGQNRSAHRMDMPPWLWPSTAIRRSAFA